MTPVNKNFVDEVKHFVNNHVTLCVLTLGLAIPVYSIGNLLSRAVSWIKEALGTTKKTHDEGLKAITSKTDSVASEPVDPSVSPVELKDRSLVSIPNSDPLKTTAADILNIKAEKCFPVVNSKEGSEPGFFVDVLNARGYTINGIKIEIPEASVPVLVSFQEELTFDQQLLAMKDPTSKGPLKFSFVDQSTEEAINVRNSHFKIALNFANEYSPGGGPGFFMHAETGQFFYQGPSARAQEESMSQRSDLMTSLTKLPHVVEVDTEGHARSYYTTKADPTIQRPFNSTREAYVSDNHLFAVQNGTDFYNSKYLEDGPQQVSFVTSAARYYRDEVVSDFGTDSPVYIDALCRIRTHLLAAATRASQAKKSSPDQKTELILGAFGCGAFIPMEGGDEYRKMIAGIYNSLVPKLEGIIDLVTYAVPTFGITDAENPAVINNTIFKANLIVRKDEL